ncbi:hypothetical protein HYU23_04515 [Candidatus Woesearchaeota archaeon]|nr:hypothetical protein [Candidatus Woesearchaeota archaeon]
MKKTFMAFLFLLIILLAACSKQRSTDIGNRPYKQLCKSNGDVWMEMKPMIKGEMISDQECFGCMIENNHFCKVDEYTNYINGLQFSEMEHETSMNMNDDSIITSHAGKESYVEVHKYFIGFISNDLISGSSSELTFNIRDKTSGLPVPELDIVHDKIMHVVLVRNDLEYFDHIHPKQKETGLFSVPYKFYAQGEYRVWIDFTVDGIQHIVDFDVMVTGNSEDQPAPDNMENLNIEIKLPSEIKVNEPAKLDFIVRDNNNNPIFIKEKFLGANAHLIVIDKTLSEFGHSHDEKFDGDNNIPFEYSFKNTGQHKLWLQFSIDKVIRTAEFELNLST